MSAPRTVSRGMPGPLPPGERVLWQGSPDARVLARRTFHIGKLALYFGILVAWVAADATMRGEGAMSAAASFGRAAAAAGAVLAIVAAYAWAVARGSTYTVTDRRVVVRIGLALPVTINLPFARIDTAAVRAHADGSGDISLALHARDRLAYVVLWPHVRPWRFARAQPTLRGLADVQPVATLLARALAASADMPAPVLHGDVSAGAAVPQLPMPA